jgi:hypothetical protein
MVTRIIIDLEDMPEVDRGGMGLWLEMMIREETEHVVKKLTVQRMAV